jgi:hypothetical protein
MDIKSDLNKSIDKAYSKKPIQGETSHNDPTQDAKGVKDQPAKGSSIHDTSGGEMPDPDKMPLKTKFHLDIKNNI